jgi:predicted ATPase/DNA-binding SARP family transcriptional activator
MRFRTRKAALLLAYLAYYPQRNHLRGEIVELLWPEVEPETGRHNLRQALLTLRHHLAPPDADDLFFTDKEHLRLNPIAFETDVAEYIACLKAADDATTPRRITALRTAIEIYRGPLLPGCYDDWVLTERERLAEKQIGALHLLADLLREAGDCLQALDCARRALEVDPYREDSCELVMRFAAAADRVDVGLRVYEEWGRRLEQELQVAPSSALRLLAAQLRQSPAAPGAALSALDETRSIETGESTETQDTSPPIANQPVVLPPATMPVTRRVTPSLPLVLTRLFGREDELARLQMLLQPYPAYRTTMTAYNRDHLVYNEKPAQGRIDSPRLITITGSGGTGKTRLAIEASRRSVDAFMGAVWFVSLAALSDSARLFDTILAVVNPRRDANGEPLDQIVAFFETLNRAEAASTHKSDLEEGDGRAPLAGAEAATSTLPGDIAGAFGAMRRPALLVLDNFEQMDASGGALLLRLLERVPSLTLLVTSRRRLEVPGERVFAVWPLPPPTDEPATPEELLEYAVVQMFADRAQASRPDFAITPHNAQAIAALCRALEGIPLAIELAAARVGILTPGQILERLSDRFTLLVNRRSRTSPRLGSLWAAIDWSYQLLPPELQHFFTHLAIFHDGWTLESAQAVCLSAAAQPSLEASDDSRVRRLHEPERLDDERTAQEQILEMHQLLEAHSLILAEEIGGQMRYRMLETLRAYADARLTAAERSQLARSHVDYMIEFSAQAEQQMLTGANVDAKHWADRFEWEAENYRAAMNWCLENGEAERAMRLVIHCRIWQWRVVFSEAQTWLDAVLRLSATAPTVERAQLLENIGTTLYRQGKWTAARTYYELSLRIYSDLQDKSNMAGLLRNLGDVAPNDRAAVDYFGRSAALFLETKHEIAAAWAMVCQAGVYHHLQELETAQRLYTESLSLVRQFPCLDGGNQALFAWIIFRNAQFHCNCQNIEIAATLCAECDALFRARGSVMGIAQVRCVQGRVALARGDLTTAQSCLAESLALFRKRGNMNGIIGALFYQALVSIACADTRRALRRFQEMLRLQESLAPERDAGRFGTEAIWNHVALIAYAHHDKRNAALLMGASARMTADRHPALLDLDIVKYEQAATALKADLGAHAFQAAWEHGSAMDRSQAVAVVLALRY